MRPWTEWRNTDAPALRLVAGETGLCVIRFLDELPVSSDSPFCDEASSDEACRDDSHPLLVEAIGQLRAYFAGSLREFRLPLQMEGTDFQRGVWSLICQVPYGQTRSYRDLALALGRPQAVRAVGAANGANPLPIVVPCHRVIGSNGALTGYGGGMALKRRLLDLEKGISPVLLNGTKGLQI
jgi:methylated-DNA-[protein]-cysteine S-methyltransferase